MILYNPIFGQECITDTRSENILNLVLLSGFNMHGVHDEIASGNSILDIVLETI